MAAWLEAERENFRKDGGEMAGVYRELTEGSEMMKWNPKGTAFIVGQVTREWAEFYHLRFALRKFGFQCIIKAGEMTLSHPEITKNSPMYSVCYLDKRG